MLESSQCRYWHCPRIGMSNAPWFQSKSQQENFVNSENHTRSMLLWHQHDFVCRKTKDLPTFTIRSFKNRIKIQGLHSRATTWSVVLPWTINWMHMSTGKLNTCKFNCAVSLWHVYQKNWGKIFANLARVSVRQSKLKFRFVVEAWTATRRHTTSRPETNHFKTPIDMPPQ